MKVLCLTSGDLSCVKGITEVGETQFNRMTEVSRRGSRVDSSPEALNKQLKYYLDFAAQRSADVPSLHER